ncbi:hypothetical protein [Pediococcus pentosaceus]|uniref:hypothetical protein n=1 Tax=Pediococcus pentosaceus TaxID=1255 RepID=UPI0003C33689|nr:hypothetical protein [Pediococcus pentosaceus]AHA05904.1 hypothetical protein T256_02435 [Pediococcus pentosaceus SL4]
MKKLINVLWAIEKDLHIIASNTEALKSNKEFIGFDESTHKPKFNMKTKNKTTNLLNQTVKTFSKQV